MLALDPDNTTQERVEKPGPKVAVMGAGLGTELRGRSVKLPPMIICGSAPSGMLLPLESTQASQYPPLAFHWIWQLTGVFCRMASNFANLSIPANCDAVELSW